MGKVHPACAGQHPILSLLPLWVLALRVQAQGARKLRADRGFSPGPAISLAGFLVTLYGRIEVTPEDHSPSLGWDVDPVRQIVTAAPPPMAIRLSVLSVAPDCSEDGSRYNREGRL